MSIPDVANRMALVFWVDKQIHHRQMKRCLAWGFPEMACCLDPDSLLFLVALRCVALRWASNVLLRPRAEVNTWVQHCFAWLDELVAGRFNMTVPFWVGYSTVFRTCLEDNGALESWKRTYCVIQTSKTVSSSGRALCAVSEQSHRACQTIRLHRT